MTDEPHDDPRASGTSELDPYVDAADRLERAIETQISIIGGIDDKAEHVTRLIGILLGLVFSVLSLIANFDTVAFGEGSIPVEISFVVGTLGLLLAMAAAIVTYLSSRFRIGHHYEVGYYLGDPETNTDSETHVRRVLGSYGEILEENERVIETNSSRFRRTLSFLLLGVLYLSTAGTLYVGRVTGWRGWFFFAAATVLAIAAVWYLLTGKYITLESLHHTDD